MVSTKARIEKLGVKAGSVVLVLGVEGDCAFMDELRARGAIVRTGGNKPMDIIFALFRHRNDLRRLPSLVPRLKAGRRALDPSPQGIPGPRGSRDHARGSIRWSGRRQGRQLLRSADGREIRHSGRQTPRTQALQLVLSGIPARSM